MDKIIKIIDRGPQGPQGPQGPSGDKGDGEFQYANFLDFIPEGEHEDIKNYTSTYDAADDLKLFLRHIDDNRMIGFVPAGLYRISSMQFSRFNFLRVIGAGIESTIFKRHPNAINVTNNTVAQMIDCQYSFDVNTTILDEFVFHWENMTFDGDEESVPNPPLDDLSRHEQSALLKCVAKEGNVIENVIIRNLSFKNPTGDSLKISGQRSNEEGVEDGYFHDIVIENVFSRGRVHRRSDIQFTTAWKNVYIKNCIVDDIEIEPDSVIDISNNFSIENVRVRQGLDLNFKDFAEILGKYPKVFLKNISVGSTEEFLNSDGNLEVFKRVNIHNVDAEIDNFDFKIQTDIGLTGKYKFSNGKITLIPEYTGNSVIRESGQVFSGDPGGAVLAVFDNVDFDTDSNVLEKNLPERYHLNSNSSPTNVQYVEYRNCRFNDPRIKTAFIRNGKFRFIGNQIYYDHTQDPHNPTDPAAIITSDYRGYETVPDWKTEHWILDNVLHSDSWLYSITDNYRGKSNPDIPPQPLHLYIKDNVTNIEGRELRIPVYIFLTPGDWDNDGILEDRVILKLPPTTFLLDDLPEKGNWREGQIIKFRRFKSVEGNLTWGAICTEEGVGSTETPINDQNYATFEYLYI